MSDTKKRARLEILNHVTRFCLTRSYGDGVKYPASTSFVDSMDEKAKIGDLVAMSSAPTSKWYLSWVINIEVHAYGNKYLMESIEDGSLCWWENVGVSYLDRAEVADHPSWRWTDRQFAFKDRWWKVCFKEKDAYITLPVLPVFGGGHEVALGTRTRFSMDEHRPIKTFPDWRKVTKAMMAEFYDECVAAREALRPQKSGWYG